MNSLLDSIEGRRVLITCGTGGVGKTTVSASLAVRAALAGKRVVVITIDPAKRLATSLGLDPKGAASDMVEEGGHFESKGINKSVPVGNAVDNL
mgnify:CR=1 FL=1